MPGKVDCGCVIQAKEYGSYPKSDKASVKIGSKRDVTIIRFLVEKR